VADDEQIDAAAQDPWPRFRRHSAKDRKGLIGNRVHRLLKQVGLQDLPITILGSVRWDGCSGSNLVVAHSSMSRSVAALMKPFGALEPITRAKSFGPNSSRACIWNPQPTVALGHTMTCAKAGFSGQNVSCVHEHARPGRVISDETRQHPAATGHWHDLQPQEFVEMTQGLVASCIAQVRK